MYNPIWNFYFNLYDVPYLLFMHNIPWAFSPLPILIRRNRSVAVQFEIVTHLLPTFTAQVFDFSLIQSFLEVTLEKKKHALSARMILFLFCFVLFCLHFMSLIRILKPHLTIDHDYINRIDQEAIGLANTNKERQLSIMHVCISVHFKSLVLFQDMVSKNFKTNFTSYNTKSNIQIGIHKCIRYHSGLYLHASSRINFCCHVVIQNNDIKRN